MNNFDITQIEDSVKNLLRQLDIADAIYDSRPKSAPQTQSFIVAKVSGSVMDMLTYGEFTLGIDLFAKNVRNLKNTAKLSYMYRKLMENLPATYDRLVFDNAPTVIGDAEDGFGFHARLINIKTIIKVEQ